MLVEVGEPEPTDGKRALLTTLPGLPAERAEGKGGSIPLELPRRLRGDPDAPRKKGNIT